MLRHGTVLCLDVAHRILTDTDVLLVGDRIAEIGRSLSAPEGALEIDATDGIVMPGMSTRTGTCGRPRFAATARTGR